MLAVKACWNLLVNTFCSSLGSTLLLIERTTIDPLYLWVITPQEIMLGPKNIANPYADHISSRQLTPSTCGKPVRRVDSDFWKVSPIFIVPLSYPRILFLQLSNEQLWVHVGFVLVIFLLLVSFIYLKITNKMSSSASDVVLSVRDEILTIEQFNWETMKGAWFRLN